MGMPSQTALLLVLTLLSAGVTAGDFHVEGLRFRQISLAMGLSQSRAQSIYQDQTGFLWVGTEEGLNRYDGYAFKIFKHEPLEPNSLSNSWVEHIIQDREGRLWIATYNGLNLYRPETQDFVPYLLRPDGEKTTIIKVFHIMEDATGYLWLATNAGLCRFNPKTGKHKTWDHQSGLSSDATTCLVQDRSGDIWIGTRNGGLSRFDPARQSFTNYNHGNDDSGNLNLVNALLFDRDGKVWIASEDGPLSWYDPVVDQLVPHVPLLNQVQHMLQDEDGWIWCATSNGLIGFNPAEEKKQVQYKANPATGMQTSALLSIYQGRTGVMWLGTELNGILATDRKAFNFNHHFKTPDQPNSLSNNVVFSLLQTKSGQLWVGTSQGLNRYNEKEGTYDLFSSGPNGLSHPTVRALCQDVANPDQLWVGTYDGLDLLNTRTGTITRYDNDSTDPYSINWGRISTVYQDPQDANTLWVGTSGGGLNKLDRKTGRFSHLKKDPGDPTSLSDNSVMFVMRDKTGRLWVGTFEDLNYLPAGEERRFTHLHHDPKNTNSLTHNIIKCMYEDPTDPLGYLWFGTLGGGLNRYHPKTGTFRSWREKQGLPNDYIYGILSDQDGRLWLSTNKGLSCFDLETEAFTNYDVGDGLQENEFNGGAYHKSPDGELFFGGVNGYNRFRPEDIRPNPYQPEVVITDFLVFNRSVPIGNSERRGAQTILPQSIQTLDFLEIHHRDYLVQFEFSALHYSDPAKNQYAFKLEGLDPTWIFAPANKRFATYTKLAPGAYTFRVKAANKDGLWNDEGTELRLWVNSPPWRSRWAYTLYALLALGTLYSYIRGQQRKLQKERSISKQLQQVDKLKDEFLANTSHELRTPLNGIIGLAESLVESPQHWEQASTHLNMIVASGRRLANLVNDILDFAQMKNQEIVLRVRPVNLRALTHMVLTLSRVLLGTKKVTLHNRVPADLPLVNADEDRLQQILYNLVGNAIKFTVSGHVEVIARIDSEMVSVTVNDTGIGIAKSAQERIFHSFAQADGSIGRAHGGTGLGLAITRHLVHLHGGSMSLVSEVDKGSSFTFSLPIAGTQVSPNEEMNRYAEQEANYEAWEEKDTAEKPKPKAKTSPPIDNNAFRILIVDDEAVNRQVLMNHLVTLPYTVSEAADGIEALKIVEEQDDFDLILLDVMMPNMSGYEVCRILREKYPVHELPVLFLTARNQPEDLAEGFNAGASDYLYKPIARAELLARVDTHLRLLDVNRTLETRVQDRTKALILQEKMASLGVLTAGIAHEINNPVTFAHSGVQNLEVGLSAFRKFIFELASDDADDEILEDLSRRMEPLFEQVRHIKNGTQRIAGIVRDLKVVTRLDEAEIKRVDVGQSLKAMSHLVQASYPDVNFEWDLHDNLYLECRPGELNQVFLNLITNGCLAIMDRRALGQHDYTGYLTIRGRMERDKLVVRVEDNGTGMDETVRERAIEPFFTTRDPGSGTGLGLAVAYGILETHGGSMQLNSRLGNGTRVMVTLPTDKSWLR